MKHPRQSHARGRLGPASTLAPFADGTVAAWGANGSFTNLPAPVAVPGLSRRAATTTETDDGTLALTEHVNGTSWSIRPAANPGQLTATPDNGPLAAASPGPRQLWAVGSQAILGQEGSRTLALMTSDG